MMREQLDTALRRRTAAVIVAGGTGERFGAPGGKQTALVEGTPVLAHTIRAFDDAPDVCRICVVVHPEREEEYRVAAVEPFGFRTPVDIVGGGDTRQQSVANGLATLAADGSSPDLVAVHDGARPLVTPQVIGAAIAALAEHPDWDGVVVGHPAFDTLKLVAGDTVVSTPDRSAYWVAQTPQVFRTVTLQDAYDRARTEGLQATDDAALVEAAGGVVGLVRGARTNIKVTVAEDVDIVAAILRHRAGGAPDD